MKHLFRKWCGPAAVFALAISTIATHAAQVQTLGGGPNQTSPARAGFKDGATLTVAKFRNPYGVAADGNGNLYVADLNNNKIRKITKVGSGDSLTTTFVSRLPAPIGVAVDRSNNVYVVTQRDGKLRKYSSSGTLLQTVSGLTSPTALALDDNNVFVTELNGNVKKIAPDGTITLITGGFRKPRGITVLENGLLAVSDTGNNAIYSVDPSNGATSLIAGGNGPGFSDGSALTAQFNQPYGLAAAPNGALVVADNLNNRVRVIETNGEVSTLYGVPRSQWQSPFPGWVDGPGGPEGTAASRKPVGVTVSTNGDVFTTELAWQLVRAVTDTGLGISNTTIIVTNGPGGSNVIIVLNSPTFGPTSGYFPFGVTITVTSAAPVYYTTDGTDPTTNSHQVVLVGGVGSFRFNESLRDLTSLRLRAITSNGASATVGGASASQNEFGIPRDFVGGSGANIVVPVVANLRPGIRIQSFQYRVEITPRNGAPPILPSIRALPISTNDFIQLATPSSANKDAKIQWARYTLPDGTIGLIVTASGTNANVDFGNFAATAMLSVPIDPATVSGSSYNIRVAYASVTTNGYDGDVPVVAGPSRTITVGSTRWLVGDVAPSAGYNAGEFGDGNLANNDANEVLFASLGLRKPFDFTDAFNAMDAHFLDEPGIAGGNGLIENIDWQIVLQRSLRLDPTNWFRQWIDGGIIDTAPAGLAADRKSARASAPKAAAAPGDVWARGATLMAGNIERGEAGVCEVPISIKVAPGSVVSGMAFRVIVDSEDGAPPISGLTFNPYIGENAFQKLPGGALNDLVCAWIMVPTPSFSLTGSGVIGTLRFSIPGAGLRGHYKIRFLLPSGAEDLSTAVSFDSIPGMVWLYQAAQQPFETTADEWRANFFGTTNNVAASQFADPDGDGVPNWEEYLEGTDPTDAGSYLHLGVTGNASAVTLSWLSAPAKLYIIERGSDANGWQPLVNGVVGNGSIEQVTDYGPPPGAQYRIRVQP